MTLKNVPGVSNSPAIRRGESSSSHVRGSAGPDPAHDGVKYVGFAREDYVRQLPTDPRARVLEIGCATGNTGVLALQQRKCGYYCGVEICEPAAQIAARRISDVIVADVEKLVPPWPERFFDALILSEVLEHLREPWSVLQKLRRCLRVGALVFASSPNIVYYKTILMLLAGRWDLSDKGIMDRTHLRWFTPSSFRDMFTSCGYDVMDVRPVAPLRSKARVASLVLGRKRQYFFWEQINIRATCRAV